MPFKNISRPRNITAEGRKVLGVAALEGNHELRIVAKGGVQHLYLDGVVGGTWYDDSGIKKDEVYDAIDSIPVGTKIRAHINSEGGCIQTGLGIYAKFDERKDDITVQIDGYAMSIASIFPLSAGRVISPNNAIWMTHCASCGSFGNAYDKEADAKMLKEYDEMLADIYVKHTGKSKSEILADMKAITWIRGSKAVDYGLADEGDDTEDTTAKYNRIPAAVLALYKNIPPNIYNSLSAPTAGNKPTQPTVIMNKVQMLALLAQWGVKVPENATDEQIVALVTAGKPTPATAAKAEPENVTDLAAIRAQLAEEKRARITAKVESYVTDQKITNAEVAIFVSAALADEKATFKILDEKESALPGGEPVAWNGHIEFGPGPTVNGFQGKPTEMVANMFKEHKTPQARYDALKQDYPRFYQDAMARDRRLGVRNENNFAAAITTNFLIMAAITKLGPMVPALRAFSRDNSVDPYKPLATGIQPFNTTVQDSSDVQTNATDFRTGDSTLAGPAITVAQYTKTIHITNSQLNSGERMAWLAEAALGSLASKIAQVVTTPITVANFGGQTPLVINPGAFGFSDMATLQGQLKKSRIKNLILDGEYQARVANVPGFFQTAGVVGGMEGAWKAYGWDLIALLTEWQAAGPFVRGFACNPQAIGIIAGLPLNPPEGIPGNVVQIGSVMLDGPGIPIATYLWFDPNSRTLYASYDLMLGATAIDTTAGILITSQ